MIEILNLTKRYKSLKAIDNLTINVKEGEIFGLLGPNGAGKTTTIRILSTLTLPTSGRVLINGYDVINDPVRAKNSIGVVHQTLNVDPDLTGYNNLLIHGMLFGMKRSKIKLRIKKLANIMGLEERLNDYVSSYSGGMKRKLTIVRALLHKPQLLIMDEPTVGLDVLTRRKIWDLIKSLNKQGVTIFMTTHHIEEVEYLSHRVAIINRGKLIEVGRPYDLKQKFGKYVLEIYKDSGINVIFFRTREEITKYTSYLIEDYSVRNTSLEDIFISLTGKSFNS